MFVKIINWKKVSASLLAIAAIFVFLSLQTQAAEQSDAIAVRIMPNSNHDSIEAWYNKQGFRGAPQSLIVDGYDAIRDGRTVFINAANLDSINNKIYTNIYLISYNQESSGQTVDILGQLVSHWKFNSNLSQSGQCSISNLNCQADKDCPKNYLCSNSIGGNQGKCIFKENDLCLPGGDTNCSSTKNKTCLIDSDCPVNLFCDSLKAKVTRDVNRLGDFNQIKEALDFFKASNGNYPGLQAGTYVLGSSISLWPSWKETLWSQLKISQLLVDPINTLGYCAGYDPVTCWNKERNEFVNPDLTLPNGSYAYIYTATKNGVNYNLCGVFEAKAAGYDTAEGQLTSQSCSVGAGYSGADSNSAPILVSSYTDGEVGKEFNGFVKARDLEGDLISWGLTPISTNWSSWSAQPVLKDTGDFSQKKIYALKTGNQGVYKMALKLTDSRGVATTTVLTFNINAAGKPKIEAENVDYFVDPINKFNYTFYIQGSESVPVYTFLPVNPGANQLINGSIANATKTLTPIGLNRVKVDLSVLFPTSTPILQNITIPYRITAIANGSLATKEININFKMEQPYLDFQCENMARLGKSYQISSTNSPRPCLLGSLKSGNHSFVYTVVGPAGLEIGYDGDPALNLPPVNAYLKGNSVTGNTGTSSNLVKVKIINEYGANVEKSFNLKINTFCGDGIKQKDGGPNTEGRGGLYNDGLEECDGRQGVATSVSTSSALQYACTTGINIESPYPILNNNSCVFKAADSGGGYCGDGVCQFKIGSGLMENCSNCPQDCGVCACQINCAGKICGSDGCGGTCGACDLGDVCTNNACCPSEANIQVCADNEHITYFNGSQVGSGNDWHNIEEFSVSIESGENVMAIKAIDNGGIWGFSATLNQGSCKSMTTDDLSNWKCTGTFYPNWNTVNYDDSNWPNAIVAGAKGVRPGNYLTYQQIWAYDANHAETTIYCRYIFSTEGAGDNPSCTPNCVGKCGGPNGCNGTCPSTCSSSSNSASECLAPAYQVCQPICTPQCNLNHCGQSNGCGGTCTCTSGYSCNAGWCVNINHPVD